MSGCSAIVGFTVFSFSLDRGEETLSEMLSFSTHSRLVKRCGYECCSLAAPTGNTPRVSEGYIGSRVGRQWIKAIVAHSLEGFSEQGPHAQGLDATQHARRVSTQGSFSRLLDRTKSPQLIGQRITRASTTHSLYNKTRKLPLYTHGSSIIF